jgi:chromosomal replication initiator protein
MRGINVQQDKLWQAVLGDIEISLSRGNYLTWFKNTQLLRQDEQKLIIGVPNVFIKQQLERKYNELVTDTVRKNGITSPVIEYKIQSVVRRTETDEPMVTGRSSQQQTTAIPQAKAAPSGLTHTYRQGLRQRTGLCRLPGHCCKPRHQVQSPVFIRWCGHR